MNLQATHPHPWVSAVALDDKRIVKMCLESAQMYCTVTGDGPYRSTHSNHPVTRWAHSNLSWLIRFHHALAGEYFYRFGKAHKSFVDVGQHMRHTPDVEPTHFVNAARTSLVDVNGRPMDFTDIADTHLAYRYYMRARWHGDTMAAKWTRRMPPFWISENLIPRNKPYPLMIKDTSGTVTRDGWGSIFGRHQNSDGVWVNHLPQSGEQWSKRI
jgi:hypothetical protein